MFVNPALIWSKLIRQTWLAYWASLNLEIIETLFLHTETKFHWSKKMPFFIYFTLWNQCWSNVVRKSLALNTKKTWFVKMLLVKRFEIEISSTITRLLSISDKLIKTLSNNCCTTDWEMPKLVNYFDVNCTTKSFNVCIRFAELVNRNYAISFRMLWVPHYQRYSVLRYIDSIIET